MPDQITDMSATGAARMAPESFGADKALRAGEQSAQSRPGTSIREQFNPLGGGLGSIWPQSVCGY
ncbi:hypothetical protein [Paenarthrobacter sp. NCHU4564]|uniref:hypothetical protein n=1 Tax=Paenarthrobacter sp. NCHU4564 TaxID=3451353 RepID=UPI003F9BDAF5